MSSIVVSVERPPPPARRSTRATASSAPANARRLTRPRPRNATWTGHDDRDRGAERGAAGRAEDVRVGERVAQQALERRARDREPEAHDERGQHARQPQLHDDRLGRRRPALRDRPAEEPVREDRDRVGRRRPRPCRARCRRRWRSRGRRARRSRAGRAAAGAPLREAVRAATRSGATTRVLMSPPGTHRTA